MERFWRLFKGSVNEDGTVMYLHVSVARVTGLSSVFNE